MFLPLVSRRMRAEDYPFRRPLIPFVAGAPGQRLLSTSITPSPLKSNCDRVM